MFPCLKNYGIQFAGRRHVICKFEMAIFKIVQVRTENITFAFLYVLSMYAHFLSITLNIHVFMVIRENLMCANVTFSLGNCVRE